VVAVTVSIMEHRKDKRKSRAQLAEKAAGKED
jgi:hypothetical protein